MKIIILALLAIYVFTTNPGILIGIPLPYSFPLASFINVPISISNFNVMETEFTNVEIRDLQFKGSVLRYKPRTPVIKETLAIEIEVSKMNVHFNFKHKQAYGPGTFQDVGMYIKFEFIILNNNGKAEIEVKRIELDEGKMAVQLGGTKQQRLLTIITNIVLNHAAPFFYSSVKSAIKNQVDNFNKVIDSQIPYGDIHMDLSLLSAPTFNSTYVKVELNGASFITDRPGFLNPSDVLQANTSKKQIQVLVHQDVLNNALNVYLQKNPIDFNISLSSISGVAQIDSLTLSPLFPAMATQQAQDVTLGLTASNTKVTLIPNFASLSADAVGNIYFQNNTYCKPITTNFLLNGSLIYGYDKIAVDVDNIELANLTFDPSDISSHKVQPEALNIYQTTLLRWMTSAFDGILFNKPAEIAKYGIKLSMNGEVKNKFMEISLTIV